MQALERMAIKRKAQEVKELVSLIEEYDVIALASLYKVRAAQLQELAKMFRSTVFMRVAKNVLAKMALEKSGKRNIRGLSKHLSGSNILLFTNMNPFKLSILLEKNKIKALAKAGDIAQEDIIIPAGNTGLPPGPAISELHDAGVRTRIEAGSVWVIRDTIVAKKGEVIQPKVASVLSKLGVKPLEVGLKVVAAYDDGLVLTEEQLALDLDDFKMRLIEARAQAINLSVNTSYPTAETLKLILQRAYFDARNLAINSAYLTPEVANDVLAKAYSHMVSLAIQLARINREAAPREFRG